MRSLKYTNYEIVFQEVPDEVSLVFNISGCPHRCEGCHSQYLWEDVGTPLLDSMSAVIDYYKPYITCVCFMGGDQNIDEIVSAMDSVHKLGLKTCLYSGNNEICYPEIWANADYIKIGRFYPKMGGLNKPTTNQRFYRVIRYHGTEPETEDITWKFQKEKR